MESKEKQKKQKFNKLVLKSSLMSLAVLGMSVAPAAAEYTFNGTLSDLGQVITDFLSLSDELIRLVIFGVIITAAGAVGGFITGFFGMMLGNMRVRL